MQAYIHGDSRESTLDGAYTFTLMKHVRHVHELRHHYYNAVRWLPSTSIWKYM